MSTDPKPGDVIAGRYRILETLGRGGIGTTYSAEDQQTGQQVALKELSFRGMRDWKILELFEREGRVLAHLDHPAIPHYLDYFQEDTDQDRHFYLVQELAQGQPLTQLVRGGWHADEGEVRDLARQVLEVLVYLQRLTPPVIHRDIKPQNIIRREDGSISLVDFGSVQDTYRDTITGGSTVVGTYGYMAPEQFRGQAEPASDLYGLGATMLFLLTHRSPAELPQRKLRVDFRGRVQVSPELADWLGRVLEPDPEDRFASAAEALAALRGERGSGPLAGPDLHQPAGSRIVLARTGQDLKLDIPPAGWRSQNLFMLVFAIFWNAFVFFWTYMALDVHAPLFFVLFSIPFWFVGLGLLGSCLFTLFGRTQLTMDRKHFRLIWRLLGYPWEVSGRTADIDRVELSTSFRQNAQPVTSCTIVEGVRTHAFGKDLAQTEKEWLVAQLSSFLNLNSEERPAERVRSSRSFELPAMAEPVEDEPRREEA